MPLTTEQLLQLYAMAKEEERSKLDGHARARAFYAGFVGTLLAASVYGFFQAACAAHLFVLAIGPATVILLAKLGNQSAFRSYRRFVEAVTVQAKLEQRLGATRPDYGGDPSADTYWKGEPLIAPRHLHFRETSQESSDAFVRRNADGGDYEITRRFFIGLQVLAGAYALALVALGALVAADVASLGNG